jgi:Trypsin-like peptidase domain
VPTLRVPNANVLQRVLWLRCGSRLGAGFTLEVDGHQFLITAEHVLRERSSSPIEVALDGRWQALDPCAMLEPDPWVDVAAVALRQRLTVALETVADGTAGLVIGQQVFGLGFPYAPADLAAAGAPYLQYHGGPVPYVKGATLAAFLKAPGPGHLTMLLDCYVNEGFSGGPVVGYAGADSRIHVFGVVSHYVPEGRRLEEASPLSIDRHPGLVVAHDITHAIDAIQAAGPTLGAPEGADSLDG